MLYHTENDSTTTCGQATATVLLSSRNKAGDVITSVELVYPRYIHSELLTHRVFSRSASSSRATPIEVMANEVIKDPVFFDQVGANKKGMSADGSVGAPEYAKFLYDWKQMGKTVAEWVLEASKAYGIHKQVLNRALEPWSRIRTIVTATEWDSFFKLRLAKDAQPEMQSLAKAIHGAMLKSPPVLRKEHYPYLSIAEDEKLKQWDKAMVSAARCARVSYARHDGRITTVDEDLALAEKLFNDRHLSPFEHAAIACPGEYSANFTGWQSIRRLMGY